MLSWGILTLELAVIILVFLIAAGSLNSNTQISNTIAGFICVISIASPLIAVIIAGIEALIQTIVVSILKKKRQA